MRIPAILLLSIGLAFAPGESQADFSDIIQDIVVAQNSGGKSLSEAIEQVRRQTKGQILNARTKVKGNREVHHIKVLTPDGKVKTIKVQGRRRNR